MRRSEDVDGIDPQRQVEGQRNEALSEKTIISDEPEEPRGPEVQKPDDVPPDGGYGWVVVACVSLINAHTWGINSVCILSTIILGSC